MQKNQSKSIPAIVLAVVHAMRISECRNKHAVQEPRWQNVTSRSHFGCTTIFLGSYDRGPWVDDPTTCCHSQNFLKGGENCD